MIQSLSIISKHYKNHIRNSAWPLCDAKISLKSCYSYTKSAEYTPAYTTNLRLLCHKIEYMNMRKIESEKKTQKEKQKNPPHNN